MKSVLTTDQWAGLKSSQNGRIYCHSKILFDINVLISLLSSLVHKLSKRFSNNAKENIDDPLTGKLDLLLQNGKVLSNLYIVVASPFNQLFDWKSLIIRNMEMLYVLVFDIYRISVKSDKIHTFTVARDKIFQEVDTYQCVLRKIGSNLLGQQLINFSLGIGLCREFFWGYLRHRLFSLDLLFHFTRIWSCYYLITKW
jgi:hypothetical protein